MSTVVSRPQLRAVLEQEVAQAGSMLRRMGLALALSQRGFLDLGSVICSLSSSVAVPRQALGWRMDAAYGAGILAFGVAGRRSEVLMQQHNGRGALWSTDQVDLREPLVLALEVRIPTGAGGVHLAFSGNCRAWGQDGGCDALSVAVLKRDMWRPRCDCIWVRGRMFDEQVFLHQLAFGTWPMRTWGRVVLRLHRGGDLEVEAFGQSALIRDVLRVEEATGRTATGLPPLVHLGVLGWDYESRADIRDLSLVVGGDAEVPDGRRRRAPRGRA